MTNYIDKYYLNGTEYKIKFDNGLYKRPTGVAGGLWKLNGNMTDSSGHGHDGSGSSNYSTGHDGTSNSSYYASSSSYYVSIPSSSDLYMGSGEKFSIGFRIKPNYSSGTASTKGVISMTRNIDSYDGWSIHNDSVSKNWNFRTNNTGQSSSTGNQLSSLSWNNSEWFHFVLTYDGSTVRYYKNGDLLGSFSYTIGDCQTTYPLTIGYATTRSASGTAYYQDVFYMKNYQLNQTEITKIYQKGFN